MRIQPAFTYTYPSFNVLLLLLTFSWATPNDSIQQDKAELSHLQELVGKWKGTGLLRRGSTRGSWRETSTWAWKFTKDRASLKFSTPGARFLRKGEIRPGPVKGQFQLVAELPNSNAPASYLGARNKEGKLVMNLEAGKSSPPGAPARLTFSLLVKGKRLVALYEGQNKDSGRYFRLAEVGYTLFGESISRGSGQPECIVTGGRGTIGVEHEGKDYTVCCKGCLDAFQDDPDSIIAQWHEKRKNEAKPDKKKNNKKTPDK